MSTDWEQHYQEGHMPWDKGSAAPPLIDWIAKHPNQLSGDILVPGCGLGHDIRALAALEQQTTILGLDLSPKAIELAKQIAPQANEQYIEADLFTMDGQFDCIWEHTCFCAIDPERRDDYVSAVYNLLKPKGTLLAVFYLNPYDNDHQPNGGPPHGTSVEELHQRFVEKGDFQIVDEYIPTVSYPGREGLEYVIQFTKTSEQ